MPKITIEEKNSVRNLATIGTDIPYIPGFFGDDKSNESSMSAPKLFTSETEFTRDIGKEPAKFAADSSIGTLKLVSEGDCDKSYILARELLKQGMPVYYHAFSKATEAISTSQWISLIDGNVLGDTHSLIVPGSAKEVDINFTSTDKEVNLEFKTKAAMAKDVIRSVIGIPTGLTMSSTDTSKFIVQDNNSIKVVHEDGIAAGTTLTIKLTASEAEVYSIKEFDIGHSEGVTLEDALMTTFYTDVHTYLDSKDLSDMSEYTIKYITSGGYPNVDVPGFDLFTDMIDIADDRKDCIAIGEYTDNADANILRTDSTSFINSLTAYKSEYATAFYPWATHRFITRYDGTNDKYIMPACYSYLISLAKSIRTNPNWLAIAGVGRGYIPSIESLNLSTRLSNTIADAYQPTEGDGVVALNAITMIKPYGYTIWGNRTLKPLKSGEKLNPTHFLNTRNMISDIKKVCYSAAKALMFEQNSELLWLDFKGRIAPYLEKLSAGNGISGYSILRSDVKSNGEKVNSEEVACVIRIYPISSVESFDIMIDISDSDVSVAE